MENHFWRIGKKVLGVVLIVGGILGLFLPFLQGIAMIVVGAILLDNKYILNKVKQFKAYLKRRKKKQH